MTPLMREPEALRSQVKYSTIEQLGSLNYYDALTLHLSDPRLYVSFFEIKIMII